ncbi:MAG: DNA polymerase III subunit delta, partial [Acidimicrobiales bacterium]
MSISSGIIVVHGDDEVLVDRRVDELVAEITEARHGDLEVFSSFGTDPGVEDLLATCTQVPMFSAALLIVIKTFDRLSADQFERAAAALAERVEENPVVLGVSGMSKLPVELRKFIEAQGTLIAAKIESKGELDYLSKVCGDSPLRFTPDAIQSLRASLGNDLSMAPSIVKTISAAFAEGSIVDASQIEPYLSFAGDVAPWKLIDHIEAGRTREALDFLAQLMDGLDRPSPLITAILANHFMELAALASPTLQTLESKNAALEAAGFRPKQQWLVDRRWAVAKGLRLEDLRRIFRSLGDAERDLRGGSGLAERYVMDLLVARLSS